MVDEIGGIHRAIELARECAGLKDDERVKILEISKTKGTPLDMIRVYSIDRVVPDNLVV